MPIQAGPQLPSETMGLVTSTDKVRLGIAAAETDFVRCWEILVAMKYAPHASGLAEMVVLDFQRTLAKALFKLEELYSELCGVRRETIRRKSATPNFENQMRELALHRESVNKALKFGRSLGDAYAWFFYHGDQHRLREHLARPANPHLPIGLGGRGEIAFISGVHPGRFMLLYHGITTFLRLGDVSFIDMETREVVALGELKTRSAGPNWHNVQLHIVGSDRNRMPFDTAPISDKLKESPELEAAFKERLDRQIRSMRTGVVRDAPHSRSDVLDGFHLDCLKSLGGKMEGADFAHEKVGQGLLLTGIRCLPGIPLAKRLMTPLDDSVVAEPIAGMLKLAPALMDPESSDNGIIVGELSSRFDLGCAPPFWWPMSPDFARKLYFGEVVVATIYNPAHLLKKIRALGFGVSKEKGFKIERKIGDDRMVAIENLGWYISSVKDHLMKEEKVIEMISYLLQKVETGEIPVDSRIEMDVATNLM